MGSHTLKTQLSSWWANSTQLLHAWSRRGRPTANYGEIEKFVLFVGYPRSGHTLIGSLLTAHPDVVIAHELDLLKYLARGIGSRATLFELLLNRDRIFTARGREWTDYNYAVPGQWQGRHRRLRVLGDKKGGESARRLARAPDLLGRLQRTVGVPVHVVHVVRNPFDNIATMAWRTRKGLDYETRNFFTMAAACLRTREELPAGQWHHLTHEAFVARPREALTDLCRFLEVEAESAYVEACAGLVRESPNLSRNRVEWSEGQKAEVRRRMAEFDFFEGYTFED
jgi:hypothetical protein